MRRTNYIVLGALLAAIAAIFQLTPVLLSEAAVILTILSTLPVYLSSRLKPSVGVMTYFVAAILIFLFSTHEALFFMCTNGVVGLSLGICRYFKLKRHITLLISTITLTSSLGIMNYGIGIPIFGTELPGILLIQILILTVFSILYNFIFLLLTEFLYKRIKFSF